MTEFINTACLYQMDTIAYQPQQVLRQPRKKNKCCLPSEQAFFRHNRYLTQKFSIIYLLVTLRNELYYKAEVLSEMEKRNTIPEGYMTVGELAKKMGVTVRTLQHYDREGLLPPSAISEGGRRLYTDKDIVKLHQILALKHLKFSLDDIKNRLALLDTPDEIAKALTEQAAGIQKRIETLSEVIRELEALRDEVLQMQSVDFKKYADIIVNLEMKNDLYWLIKHFDNQTLDHVRRRFDKESGEAFMQKFIQLQNEAIQLRTNGISAASEQGLQFAEKYWAMITEFTGGDMNILSRLVEFSQLDCLEQDWKAKQDLANTFVEPALNAYFTKLEVNPFQEGVE